jgi:6-phosphogluconolactonase
MLPNKSVLAVALTAAVAVGGAAVPLTKAFAAAIGSDAASCERIYVGTHQQGGRPSLFTAAFDARDGGFGPASAVASLERPTWLLKDPSRPILYAVSETGNDGASHGKVLSLRVQSDTGQVSEVGAVDSGGGGPTHLALDDASGTLLVANYGTGQAAALAVDGDGTLAGPASVVDDHGSGPTPRQAGPHAHGVTIDPSRRYALVPDLGADRVFIYRFDANTRQLAPAATPFVQLPPGTGPRHIVFTPDGHTAYLLTELTGDLIVYAWDGRAGQLKPVQKLSTLSAGYQGKISAGEILVARDGKHVYVSSRGDDTIVVYQAASGTGRLQELQRIPSGGVQPWSLALSPNGRWLLAANETSNAVTAFRVGGDGQLTATQGRLEVATPVSIVFAGACVRR